MHKGKLGTQQKLPWVSGPVTTAHRLWGVGLLWKKYWIWHQIKDLNRNLAPF